MNDTIYEIKQHYSYISEQNMGIACYVLGKKCQTLARDLKNKFPPVNINNLAPKLLELAKKLNKGGLLYALIESGNLSLPIKQEALLQELKKMNIDHEFCLDKKEKALQMSIAEQEELVQELMEMSKIGHEKLIKMMLEEFDKFLVAYHKLDKLRQEIKDLKERLENIIKQLEGITQKLQRITIDLEINATKLSSAIKLLQSAENDRRQKYAETVQGFDPDLARRLIDADIERSRNSTPDSEQNYQQALQDLSNHERVAVEQKLAEHTEDRAIIKQALVKSHDALSEINVAAQNPELSQAEKTALEKRRSELEAQIAADEIKKKNFDEQINDYSDLKATLELQLERLKEEFKDGDSDIDELTEEVAALEKDKNNLEKKKTELIKQEESLKKEAEILTAQLTDKQRSVEKAEGKKTVLMTEIQQEIQKSESSVKLEPK